MVEAIQHLEGGGDIEKLEVVLSHLVSRGPEPDVSHSSVARLNLLVDNYVAPGVFFDFDATDEDSPRVHILDGTYEGEGRAMVEASGAAETGVTPRTGGEAASSSGG